jgi:hypothetical protein
MELFLQEMGGRADGAPSGQIGQNDYNRFRSVAMGCDESAATQNRQMRAALMSFDMMGSALKKMGGGVANANVSKSSDGGNNSDAFTVRTVSACKRVSEETERVYTEIVQPWHSRETKRLATRDSKIRARLVQFAKQHPPTARETVSERAARLQKGKEYELSQYAEFDRESASFQSRYVQVKKELIHYHLQLLKTGFTNATDMATIPHGYVAMYHGLERGIVANGGSASIAFNGGSQQAESAECSGKKQRGGRQLTKSDASVYASMHEFLRTIFIDACKINGRDRRLMDAMYLHSFNVYSPVRFMLILASEKGKGKSVRAYRMSVVLPAGTCSTSSASSAKSGMQGNNSPSNGTMVIADEMLADLTAADCGERLEYYKTLTGTGEYQRECAQVVSSGGTERHVTCKVITEHKEVYTISTNMGQCFTENKEQEPSTGKAAMVQRTFCLFARSETEEDSPNSEFVKGLKSTEGVITNVRDFRLFTSLVSFCCLAMMDCTFLIPDLAMAVRIFAEGDEMLHSEYGMPKPEPRRMVERTQRLLTMCAMEAVARVFFFKQTAINFESGRPVDGTTAGQPFDITQLYDALRIMHPTREMILGAWTDGLEFSIGTSSHGTNLMTALCEKAGMKFEQIFRRQPSWKAESRTGMHAIDPTATEEWFDPRNPDGDGDLIMADGEGAKTDELAVEEKRLRDTRVMRNQFRQKAAGTQVVGKNPADSIDSLMETARPSAASNALFPSFTEAAMYYKPRHLLAWAVGDSNPVPLAEQVEGYTDMHFRQTQARGTGGSKTFDFAWISVHDASGSRGTGDVWHSAAKALSRVASVTNFDMHEAGLKDGIYMLASTENKRFCPEMPVLPIKNSAGAAFPQEGLMSDITVEWGNSNEWHADDIHPSDPHPDPQYEHGVRLPGDLTHPENTPIHLGLDRINSHGRLPLLQPHMSTNVCISPPVRKGDNQTLELNSVIALEHMQMILEGILSLSPLPGLKGLQEKFIGNKQPPPALRKDKSSALLPLLDKAEQAQKLQSQANGFVKVLPYAYDLMQMAWGLALARRFFNSELHDMIAFQNERVRHSPGRRTPDLSIQDMPELHLRFSGFPSTYKKDGTALKSISIEMPPSRPVGQKEVPLSDGNRVEQMSTSAMREATVVALGRTNVTSVEMEAHRSSLMGQGYMRKVEGDLFDFTTWKDHAHLSLSERGNVEALPDEMGVGDHGLVSFLDAETMIESRWEEHQTTQRYDLTLSTGGSYGYMERNPTVDDDPSEPDPQQTASLAEYGLSADGSRKRQKHYHMRGVGGPSDMHQDLLGGAHTGDSRYD